jgi:hypothetical protein
MVVVVDLEGEEVDEDVDGVAVVVVELGGEEADEDVDVVVVFELELYVGWDRN